MFACGHTAAAIDLDAMTYPAADDPLLPEPALAALEYRAADAGPPRHSWLGVAAFVASPLSPLVMLGLLFFQATGVAPPPPRFVLLMILWLTIWGGPVLGLALGTAALLAHRRPRYRRWPAITAVVLSGLALSLLAALTIVSVRA
jgi:hypothetical protein